MRAELTMIANAGLRIAAREAVVYVDAFHRCQGEGVVPWPADGPRADLILVTHAHWDHFDARSVAEAAGRTGATVIGPQSVVRGLRGKVPPGKLCEMEPPLARDGADALCTSVGFPAAKVTAYRTFHSRDHNSYLVETASFRFFHDGDNEDTRRVAARSLGKLDALLIGPWLGGGWVEFVEKLAPTRYFLLHLAEDELRLHDAGKFLPDICDRVPPGLSVLKPGETFVFD